jgi:SAM-dependent methyltransferase
MTAVEVQGALWGADAAGWAVQDELAAPLYQAVADDAGIAAGESVLEIGCATGVFLQVAAERGAHVTGLDAAATLVDRARQRVAGAELHVGDLQELPFADESFDVVVGCNVFQFADDVELGFAEAARVTRRGGRFVVQMWGRPERCELLAVLGQVRQFLPLPPPGPPGGGNYSDPGVLERLASAAGLEAVRTGDLVTTSEYPSEAVFIRSTRAAGLVVLAEQLAGPEPVVAALTRAAAPFRTDAGTYRFTNEWHWLVARKP